VDRYRTHVEEVDKIHSLLLSLATRLAKTDAALALTAQAGHQVAEENLIFVSFSLVGIGFMILPNAREEFQDNTNILATLLKNYQMQFIGCSVPIGLIFYR
jgi:hypothetical protein